SYKGEGFDHRADVVQTQTPINPGNSGGPLFNDAGELVGISTFGSGEGALINFAIASNEVRRLLGETKDRLAPATVIAAAPKPEGKKCEPVTLDTHRTKKDDGVAFVMDVDCNGKADTLLVIPDDKKKPIYLAFDDNENGKFEVVYVDENRDEKFDVAFYDIDEDGKPDLVGYDLNDDMEPGRIEAMKT
ncbi:MAG: trypsin-like peptidase domain-containing protein, partial [Alphaproteobacteria bacterium]|nr:trypsin-like peptidase domain-containing protein [Alphaproteobacteria bacterium]